MNAQSIQTMGAEMGRRARAAFAQLRTLTTGEKNDALYAAADAIAAKARAIIAANDRDVAAAESDGLGEALMDRLRLDERRLQGIVDAVRDVAALPDLIGEIIERTRRPNGLVIERVRTPIGVIAIIFESRPNVTVDAAALCLKSGNAAILRGGSEAFETSSALHRCFISGFEARGIPADAVQLAPTTDRALVGEILAGLGGCVDLIIPRGGKSLVARVAADARAPVLGHLEGLCHVYIDGGADPDMAVEVTLNAKMRRPGVCGAAETVLVDRAILREIWGPLAAALRDAGCEIRADSEIAEIDPAVAPASPEDWRTEYLDSIISAKVVDGVEGAILHIAEYGAGHTDSIITDDDEVAEYFLARVDSAIVMHNTSTQFADGGEFGLGAEIGVSTARIHARGPVGVRELTTYKNVVRGAGQVRP